MRLLPLVTRSSAELLAGAGHAVVLDLVPLQKLLGLQLDLADVALVAQGEVLGLDVSRHLDLLRRGVVADLAPVHAAVLHHEVVHGGEAGREVGVGAVEDAAARVAAAAGGRRKVVLT